MEWLEIIAPVLGGTVGTAVVLFCIVLLRSAFKTESIHVAEEKDWEALKGVGQRAEADILMLGRPHNRLVVWHNGSPNMAAADLRVRFLDDVGTAHEARLKTLIDEELLANFTVGKKLPILYSNGDPPLVAIDRERAQVSFSST
jgi:hypothetical protein